LFYRIFGFPTQSLDFGTIKEDERVIANPASVTARIGDGRLNAQSLANPAN
jgi:hypothetical protein